MRSCCILVVLACAIGGRALESRPALATRSVPMLPPALALVRGGARPQPSAAPTDIEKRVKTMRRCIHIVDIALSIPLISCYVAMIMEFQASLWLKHPDLGPGGGCLCNRWMRPIAFMGRPIVKSLGVPMNNIEAVIAGICGIVVAARACDFVAGRMLRAWRPCEFDEAWQSLGRTPLRWREVVYFCAVFPLTTYMGYLMVNIILEKGWFYIVLAIPLVLASQLLAKLCGVA